MAKSQKNKNKPKLNLTVRDEQRPNGLALKFHIYFSDSSLAPATLGVPGGVDFSSLTTRFQPPIVGVFYT
jgi:hypothetical protein